MKFRYALSRLTGISVPLFGVSWNAPEPARAAARRMLTFLEDRRVLCVTSEMEVPEHGGQSVLRIREMLTSEIGREAPAHVELQGHEGSLLMCVIDMRR